MGSEWKEMTIGDVAEIIGGSTPSTKDPENFEGDIPWITPKDLSATHERYVSSGSRFITQKGLDSCGTKLVPRNSILLTTRAPIGYIAIAANPIATNQGFRSLIVKPEFDHEFVYYWLIANKEELVRHANGSTFMELAGSALKRIKIRVPPLAEQRRIAHILGTFDDKIELNRRMNTTLEAMARALFQSWFVDFDPVRAKMDGRWRKGESLPGLPAAWWDLFPDRLVDSELGPIPEGWRVGTVGEVAEVIKGVSYSSDELQLSSTAMVTLKSFLRGGGYRTDGLKPFTGKYKTEQQVFPAELIVSFTDVTQAGEVIGQPALVHKSRIFKALVASLDVGIVRPRNPHVSTTYLYSVMLSKRFHEYIGTFVNGTTVLHLAKGGIPSYPLLIPFEITLRKWHSLCSPLTSMILELSLESEMLSDLRDQTMAILLKEK